MFTHPPCVSDVSQVVAFLFGLGVATRLKKLGCWPTLCGRGGGWGGARPLPASAGEEADDGDS